MIREELINEFITKHVFPQFRETTHPIFCMDRYFSIGLNDNDRVACISYLSKTALSISPHAWGVIKSMFSLTEDELVVILKRWFRDNFPLLRFNEIILVTFP
jgi:hypothetical protein